MMAEYDLAAAGRVFDALRPVLPLGRPDLSLANEHAILIDEDAAADR